MVEKPGVSLAADDAVLENIVCRNEFGEVECDLRYDEKQFRQSPANYLSHQFFEHQTAYRIFKKRLFVYNQKLRQEQERFEVDEQAVESIPEVLRPFAKWASRLCVLPGYLIRFTTPMAVFNKEVKEHKAVSAQYNFLKECAKNGKTFFEKCKEKYGKTLSSDINCRFDECAQMADDVTRVLLELSCALLKFVDLEERIYDLAYH